MPRLVSSPTLTPTDWDTHLLARRGHLLQSWAWGDLKSRFGWTACRLRVGDAAAQILFRRLPLGFTIAYIPKGPLLEWSNPAQIQAMFTAIHAEAKRRRAIFLKIEPDLYVDLSPNPAVTLRQPPNHQTTKPSDAPTFLRASGFIPGDAIQPRATLIVDISKDETAILAAMHQKTRYNIRLAAKKGVMVHQGSAADVSIFYQLSLDTAARDGFGLHALAYYQSAYTLFAPNRCALFLAEIEGQPIAGLMAFRQGLAAYYFYGASSNAHRNLMPAYLAQWAAIRWAKAQGCTHYDLWGIPAADPATLETEFEHRHDGLWGVYRFKRGFGGQVAQSLGAYDYVYSPALYRLYRCRRGRGLAP